MFDFGTFYSNHNKLSSFKFKYYNIICLANDITKNEVKKNCLDSYRREARQHSYSDGCYLVCLYINFNYIINAFIVSNLSNLNTGLFTFIDFHLILYIYIHE